MNGAMLCCCTPCCPADRVVELVGSLPIDITCVGTPPSPSGEMWDAEGSLGDQQYAVSAYVHNKIDCYFDPFARYCAGSNQIWPLLQNYLVSRAMCPGFSGFIGPRCGVGLQIGSEPGSINGATAGWTVLSVSSSYNTILSAHQVVFELLVPVWYDPTPAVWYWSTYTLRAYNYNTNRACFPTGTYELLTSTLSARHSWVETHITGFSGGLPTYTTTLMDLTDVPFEIRVS